MTTETQTPATDGNNQPSAAAPTATPPAAADTTTLVGQSPATPPATETAPAGAAPAAAQPPDADGKPPVVPTAAPENYDFKAPEGVSLNAEVVGEFAAFAKEKNLSQEDAQKFVDFGAKAVQRANAQTLENLTQIQTQWLSDARADKEYGGDALDENMAAANNAVATYGTPELTKMLKESKLGNHPEVIRFFYRVGKTLKPDSAVPGGTKPDVRNDGQRLYSNSNMNP